MRVRHCPICETDNSLPEQVVSGFGIVKCKACDFVYVCNPAKSEAYPDKESLSKIRSSAAEKNFRHLVIKGFLDKKFRAVDNVTVVEVGTGAGSLGILLQNCNDSTKYHYTGYEPSVPRAQVARENNLHIIHGFLEQPLKSKANVIILDNVLEHVHEPNKLLSIISKSMQPGGILLIVVPNLNDLRRFIPSWRKKYHWRPRKHISYFTFDSLSRLVHQNGFKLSPMPIVSEMPVAYKVAMLFSQFGVFPMGLYTYAVIA